MKRGTPSHPKTLELAAALDLPQWGAVGILESLWHFAAQYARRGDVGRRTDLAIARAIGWKDDPGRLIAALVETGWLDRCRCHRLRVHDWPEHADQTVARTEEVRGQGFLECYRGVEPLRGTAFAAASPSEGSEAVPGDDASVKLANASVKLAPDELQTSQPLPLPLLLPTPTEPPTPLGRLRAAGEPSFEVQRRRAVRYWIKLGGRPSRQDRRAVWDALASGRPIAQLLGSIAERVRDELVAAGQLAADAPWPPPGLAPFDPRPDPAPARASPAVDELEAAARAWEPVSAALRERLSPDAWATWIRPCRGLWLREGRLQLETPGPQHLDWIGRNWSAELQWAAAESGLEGVDLVVAPKAATMLV